MVCVRVHRWQSTVSVEYITVRAVQSVSVEYVTVRAVQSVSALIDNYEC